MHSLMVHKCSVLPFVGTWSWVCIDDTSEAAGFEYARGACMTTEEALNVG